MLNNNYNVLKKIKAFLYAKLPGLRYLRTWLMAKRYSRTKLSYYHARLSSSISATGFPPLFESIEVETINRCNSDCSFCPVNRHVDTRPLKIMTDELFSSILNQLQVLNYSGNFSLFSNNEPLMDKRLEHFAAEARLALPQAKMSLYTNGSLLTPERFQELIPNLDSLHIDNYDDGLNLTPAVQKIYDLCATRPEWNKKVNFSIRKRTEIITSRGGQAPNIKKKRRRPSVGCKVPMTQCVVRPDGGLSLCCNDALGRMTLGDINHEKIIDSWHSEKNMELRKKILLGPNETPLCTYCDTFI